MGRKQQKGKKPESESESDHELEEPQEQVPESDQDQVLMGDHDDEDLKQQDQDVLEIIKAQTQEGPEEERLTWLAIYSLKKQENQLNNKMDEEINQLKDKYDLLKQPIYLDMASVVAGKKLGDELYKPACLQTLPDVSKVAPVAFNDYWRVVFQRSGLIEDQQDLECFAKLAEFQSETLGGTPDHRRLTFKFKEQTSLFKNLVLTIESQRKVQGESTVYEVKIKEAAKWKGSKNEQSVFHALFDPSTQPQEVFQLMAEFHRDFCNSIYFYLRKNDPEFTQDFQEVDEEESSEEKQGKPTKKVKKDTEKPECKQQ